MDKKAKVLLSAYLCGMILVLTTSFFTCSFNLIIPTIKQSIGILVILTAISSITGLIFFKGLKYTIFLSMPYILFFLFLNFGIHIWLLHFAPIAERALYFPQFRSPENLSSESVYVPHHYTLYNLRPNLVTPEGTRHNRLGMRDSRSFHLEGKVIKIVFIGGSTTYTLGIKNNNKIFSYGLEQRLNEHYKDILDGYTLQVINAGLPSATSAENLLRLIFFVSEVKPQLVVVQHGINDIKPRMRGEIQSDFSNYRKLWNQKMMKVKNSSFCSSSMLAIPISRQIINLVLERSVLLTYLLRRIGYTGPGYGGHSNVLLVDRLITRTDIESNEDYLETNTPKYFERNTRYMISICNAMETKILLVTEALADKSGKKGVALLHHNALLEKIAQKEKVLFYDFNNDMVKDVSHLPDGVHVSQIGSDVKRDLFFSYFMKQELIPKLLEEVRRNVQVQ